MSTAASPSRSSRFEPVRRDDDRVTNLELFFDLVLVLALTQCTTLMARETTWAGVGKAVLVLAMIWWTWVGYAWLTSVVDPEEGAVRLAIFGAMAALLVASLCVPSAFGGEALLFALAYGVVRAGHIALFVVASREEAEFRRSVAGLAVFTGLAVGLLVLASAFDGAVQSGLWLLALAIDTGGPYFFGTEGWKLSPGHFAERHGLMIIIALGESIVAIGVGAGEGVHAGTVAAAVLGIGVTGALWWMYFDIVAPVSQRRLVRATPGREQNAMARDSYSYLHFPMIAGIALLALGFKKALGHTGDDLQWVPAACLYGGVALFLLGLVGFRFRHVRTINRQRLACAVALLALVPVVHRIPALAALAFAFVVLAVIIAFETKSYGPGRAQVRREILHEHEG